MSGLTRRTALQWFAAAAAALPFAKARLWAQAAAFSADDEATLRALAATVLPDSPVVNAASVTDGFLAWVKGYAAGTEMDHGYGETRLRWTGPTPAARYGPQLRALETAARAQGAAFGALPAAARQRLVEAALREARVEELPERPDGRHVAADLMAHYFAGSDANDLCHRARIGRDACRGLPGSENAPETLDETP